MKESIIELTKKLIQIPTQGGIDTCDEIINFITVWGKENHLDFKALYHNETVSGLLLEIKGDVSGPTICLDACLDTATAGGKEAWKNNPFFPTTNADGWLSGRGVSDSKIAISMFMHLAKEFQSMQDKLKGTLHILFDAEEHTGKFLGVKSYLKNNNPDGIYIGYPGNKYICIGARGFYRSKITFYGVAEHSGTSAPKNKNAIYAAMMFIEPLKKLDISQYKDKQIGKLPKINVTRISAGDSFSIIPDKCEVYVDIRLNSVFQYKQASEIVRKFIKDTDASFNPPIETKIEELEGWPYYKLDENSMIVNALTKASEDHFETKPAFKVSGASNIGNYLFANGIPATCGFGVDYKNLHGANESIDTKTIVQVYKTYRDALKNLLL
ncbi:M20 family metallopeptidase [Olleya sp. AH-315-K02]|nr:M20 family metallopeptidase [bacterium AH-315-P13]MBN4057910.1 M20 family metallopeptidase [Olleya sp. AH-315-K02]